MAAVDLAGVSWCNTVGQAGAAMTEAARVREESLHRKTGFQDEKHGNAAAATYLDVWCRMRCVPLAVVLTQVIAWVWYQTYRQPDVAHLWFQPDTFSATWMHLLWFPLLDLWRGWWASCSSLCDKVTSDTPVGKLIYSNVTIINRGKAAASHCTPEKMPWGWISLFWRWLITEPAAPLAGQTDLLTISLCNIVFGPSPVCATLTHLCSLHLFLFPCPWWVAP